jgi:hypothetical protein
MKISFWGLIRSSFSVIQTFWLGLLSFALSLIAWFVSAQTPIPLVVVFVIITVALFAIATLIRALRTALEEYQKVKQSVIPKILRVQKDANNNIQCLLEASDLFAAQLMISFYYTDEDGFEVLIGEGFVKNVQSDRKIQAILDQPEAGYQKILDKLVNNDFKIIQEVRIRPSIYKK